MNVVIDRTGRVAGAKIASMSKPEFGAALVAAAEAWRFTPAMKDGKRTVTVISREHRFSRGNRDLASDTDGRRLIGILKGSDSRILDSSTLENPPQLLHGVPPEYPRSLASQRTAGEATIEFVVDRRGRARLPQIVQSSHVGFGWSAATAVQQRFYEVPRNKGSAVDVRMTETFHFAPPVAPK